MEENDYRYKKGDKVRVKGYPCIGTVAGIGEDGKIRVELDNDIVMYCPEWQLSPDTKRMHDENGKFAPGHSKVGGIKKGYKHYRNELMQQLSPFIGSMGEIIEAIDDPGDKVLAISRIIKYAMPSLSSIDFKENAKRDLTAEQVIAKLNARYNRLPEPTEEEEEE